MIVIGPFQEALVSELNETSMLRMTNKTYGSIHTVVDRFYGRLE